MRKKINTQKFGRRFTRLLLLGVIGSLGCSDAGPVSSSTGSSGGGGEGALQDQRRHQARVARDKDFQYLLEDVAEFRRLRDSKQISLNEAERRKERDTQEARLKAREKTGTKDKLANLRDDGLQAGERSLAADLAAEKARKERKDVLLQEAASIVGDEADLQASATPRLALKERRPGQPVIR